MCNIVMLGLLVYFTFLVTFLIPMQPGTAYGRDENCVQFWHESTKGKASWAWKT